MTRSFWRDCRLTTPTTASGISVIRSRSSGSRQKIDRSGRLNESSGKRMPTSVASMRPHPVSDSGSGRTLFVIRRIRR